MSSTLVTSNWFRFSFPLVLLLCLWLGMHNVISITRDNFSVATNLPFVLFTAVIVLSHTFRQSRIAMVATAMMLSYWIIQSRLQSPLSSGTTLLELSLLSFLLPVACLLIYPFMDSSVKSRSYAIHLVTLSLMVVWSYLILSHFYAGGFENIDETFLFTLPSVSKLPFILVMYLLSLTGITGIFVLKHNRIVDVVVYTSIVIAGATFVFFHVPYISSTMFSLSGVLLLTYLLSASYELAFNDRLTGIPGRHALESDLKHLGRRYAIAMLDIDHFKKFNDTYGHDTGDDVLKLVASKLTEVGGKAKVYRYGGEEFTVIFKAKHSDEAFEHLEELRQSIEDYEMVLRNPDSRPKDDDTGSKKRGGKQKKRDVVTITISIGLSDNETLKKPREVIKAADQALYKAKKAGRNQVVSGA